MFAIEVNHNRRFQQMRPLHIKTYTRALHIEQRSVSEWHLNCSSPTQQTSQTYLNVFLKHKATEQYGLPNVTVRVHESRTAA
jgi:hypothetical protein